MITHFKYIFTTIAIIGSYLGATTTAYLPGDESPTAKFRNDIIRIGAAGGFDGFTAPGRNCKALYITLVESGTAAQANNVHTNSYTGSGEIPHLSSAIKDIWIEGDAHGFDTLVSGGAAYALFTPAAETTIHFLLTRAPATSPHSWFQGPLLAKCRLVIEPDSADPFINTVLPMAGGNIIIGSAVSPAVGFSTLLSTITAPCPIQRYPSMAAKNAHDKALITLREATTFPYPVNGISLSGPYQVAFNATSDLVDPSADSANAGYTIAAHKTLSLDAAFAPLPGIRSLLVEGGTSHIKVVTSPIPLPKISTINPHN
ncbi:MAG: hypothetical protein WCJ92_05435 [Alphaproteobacteria bacterium]